MFKFIFNNLFLFVLAFIFTFNFSEAQAGNYYSNGYQYAYNQQQNPQYQYAYNNQAAYTPQAVNYQSVATPAQPSVNSEVIRRIYMTSDYIVQNPSRADFYVNRLLGINTKNISLDNLQKLAYIGDKTTLIKEIAYIFKNRQAIEAGTFTDLRYAQSVQEREYNAAQQINPQLTSGLSSNWLWGGLGLAAAGGIAAALGGGSGSSSGSSEGGTQQALQTLAVCEPSSGLYDASMCGSVRDVCSNPAIANNPITGQFCNVKTSQIITLSSQNPNSTALELFCQAVNNNHFLCGNRDESEYCGSGANANPVLCQLCTVLGSSSWLCQGNGGGGNGDVCNPSSGSFDEDACCQQYPSNPLCDDNGGDPTCPPGYSQQICDYCEANNYPSPTCDDLNPNPPGGGDVCDPNDPDYDLTACCQQDPNNSQCGGGGNGDDPRGDPIEYVDDPDDLANDPEIKSHPSNALVRQGVTHAYARNIWGQNRRTDGKTVVGVTHDWFHNASNHANLSWWHEEMAGKTIVTNLNPQGDTSTGNMSGPAGTAPHGYYVSCSAFCGRDNGTLPNGKEFMGTAPDVEKLYLVSTRNGSQTVSGLNWIRDNVQNNEIAVITNSWGGGYGSSYPLQPLVDLVNDGHVVGFSAGNGGSQSATSSPANRADAVMNAASGTGVMFAVTAASFNGSTWTRRSYSDSCGSLNYYCLTGWVGPGSASGWNIEGTSFSQPFVTGFFALLMSTEWNLTGSEAFEVVRQTADDIGATGYDSLYGWGVPNMEAALDPTSNISVQTANGQNINPSSLNSSMVVSSGTPFGASIASAVKGTKVIAKDTIYGRNGEEIRRGFGYSAEALVFSEEADKKDLSEVTDKMGTSNKRQKTNVTNNLSLSLSSTNISQEDLETGSFEAFADYKVNQDVSLSVGFTHQVEDIFTNDDIAFNVNNFISPEVFELPYIQFAKEAKVLSSGIEYKFSDSLSSKITTMYSSDEEVASFAGSMLEIGYKPTNNLSFNFKQGLILEFDSIFGTKSEGLVDISDNTKTMFAGLDMNYNIDSKWSLFASAYFGVTNSQGGQNSLFSNVEDVLTESYNVALTRKDVFGDDSLTFAMSQPLRVVKGTLNGVTFNSISVRDNSVTGFSQDLGTSGRTLKFQTAYQKQIEEDLDMFISAEVVKDDNHDKNSKTQYSVVGKVKYKF